jgi:chromosome segregation ATPase
MSSTSGSGSASASVSSDKLTIDIRPLLEDVSQVMTKHITSILSGVVGEYTVYKETHETIMGLPCVRKLQDRISDLENQLNGGDPASSASASAPPTEISELQSAIVDLNRYIQVLETRMNVKNVVSSQQQVPEEAIRLEVHENDDAAATDANESEVIIPQSVHTNRIIDSSVVTHEDAEETEEDAEEEETVDAEEEETTEDAEEETAEEETAEEETAEEETAEEETAEEETAEEETAEEETAEEETAEEETAEEETAEEETAEEEETEETEATEQDAEVDVEEEEEETEASVEDAEEEIEVSEIKIKGVTYFTTSAQNGIIYACVDDDVGDEVGVFKNGVALFKSKTAKK